MLVGPGVVCTQSVRAIDTKEIVDHVQGICWGYARTWQSLDPYRGVLIEEIWPTCHYNCFRGDPLPQMAGDELVLWRKLMYVPATCQSRI